MNKTKSRPISKATRAAVIEPVAWHALLLRGGRIGKYRNVVGDIAPHSVGAVSRLADVAGISALALGTALLSGSPALAGTCTTVGSDTTCTGAAAPGVDSSQVIHSAAPVSVTTSPTFGIDVSTGEAFGIKSEGGARFIDDNSSAISADEDAIIISNNGIGDVVVRTNGVLHGGTGLSVDNSLRNLTGPGGRIDVDVGRVTGGGAGVLLYQDTGAAVDLTSTGKITGESSYGVYVASTIPKVDIGDAITLDLNDVEGDVDAINIDDFSLGDVSVSSSGDVISNSSTGIVINHYSESGNVIINAKNVSGADRGIYVKNEGVSDTNITSTGSIVGAGTDGIRIDSNNTGNVVLDVNAVQGNTYGILIHSSGAGVDVKAGDVTATSWDAVHFDGIGANATGDVKVDVQNAHGANWGVRLDNINGTGKTIISSAGNISGDGNDGILYGGGANQIGLEVNVHNVSGGQSGIFINAYNGSGIVGITSDGLIESGAGGLNSGLRLDINGGAEGLSVDVNDITAHGDNGMWIDYSGSGVVELAAHDIAAASNEGINLDTSASSTDLNINVNDVTSQSRGIAFTHRGTGSTTVVANDIESRAGHGIEFVTGGTNTTVAVHDINAAGIGMFIDHSGTGAIDLTVNDIVSTNNEGINLDTFAPSTDVTINAHDIDTAASGIAFTHRGSGNTTFTVNDVTSANNYGIWGTTYGLGDTAITAHNVDARGEGIYVDVLSGNDVTDNNYQISVNNVAAGGNGIRFNALNTGNVSVTANDIDAGGIGVWFDNYTSVNDLTIDVNNIAAGNDGINGFSSGTGATDINVVGDIVSGDDGIEVYADNADAQTVSFSVNNVKAADNAIYVGSSAAPGDDPAHNALNVTTNGHIEAGAGWGVWTQTNGGVMSNILVKDGSVIEAASDAAIGNNGGDSHVVVENAKEVVDDPSTVEVEIAAVNGRIDLGGGVDVLDLHGGFSGTTRVDGGGQAGDTLNLDNAESTYDAGNIVGWDTFNIKNSHVILDGGLHNLNVGRNGVEGTGIFLTDGSTLETRQRGMNIGGNLTLAAGTTFISDRNDDAGNPGRGDTQISGFLHNAGTVSLKDNAGDDILTVNGAYVGNNGTFQIETVLGDDQSKTDQLQFFGGTSGSSNIVVTNLNGSGAPTVEGIKVVDVRGTSSGTFTLVGDYEISGQQAIAAGAYAYTLQKNGVANSTDGDWYLRSSLAPVDSDNPSTEEPGTENPGTGNPGAEEPGTENPGTGNPGTEEPGTENPGTGNPGTEEPGTENPGTGNPGTEEPGTENPATENPDTGTPGSGVAEHPLYIPGVPIYEAYSANMQALNALSTLQQRVGNRSWTASSGPDGGGIWGKIVGARKHAEAGVSSSGVDQKIDVWKIQIGTDHVVASTANGERLVTGLTAYYGKADSDIRSMSGNGYIKTDGYGFGATLTWYGLNGFYVDGQAQLSWYSSDLKSNIFGKLADDHDGSGEAVSLEAGKRTQVSNKLSITPQLQMVYSNVRFDDLIDPTGASVEFDKGDSLKTRWGLSLDHQNEWDRGRSHIYGIVNLSYEWFDGARTIVAGTNIDHADYRFWGELGLGASVSYSNGITLYTEVSGNSPFKDFGDSYVLKGNVGLRFSF